jgi:hypothetical protein
VSEGHLTVETSQDPKKEFPVFVNLGKISGAALIGRTHATAGFPANSLAQQFSV